MNVKVAVIMIGGEGDRLLPLTNYFPKCCLPVYDEPLIVKQIKWLITANIKRVILVLNVKFEKFLSEVIRKSGLEKEVEISIVCEKEQKGLVFALVNIKERILQNEFLFLLGDEYFDYPTYFFQVSKNDSKGINLGVVAYQNINDICSGCNIELNEQTGQVLKLIEKPTISSIGSKWCWNGSAVLNQEFIQNLICIMQFNEISSKNNKLFIDAFNIMIEKGSIITYCKDECCNININTIEDYYRAITVEKAKNEKK